MERNIIKKWDTRKDTLRKSIKTYKNNSISYNELVRLIAKNILGIEDMRTHEIDDGDYQGTMIYLITDADIYQPNPTNYYVTYVAYGSCSCCDTLQGIQADGDYFDYPTNDQLDQYMTLCLHMVQRMKKLYR